MNKIEFKDLLKRYLTNECTDNERLLVEGWYDLLGDEKELEIDDLESLEEEIWNKVHAKTVKLEQITTSSRPNKPFKLKPWYQRQGWQIAASILFLIAIGSTWLYNNANFSDANIEEKIVYQHTIFNNTKQPMETWLEDSSKVTLFAGSRIDIPITFADNITREVQLKGEAIFEVTRNPNKPFLVYTGEVVTRVLGTSFRIVHKGKKENIEVAVLSGKVSVDVKNKQSQKNNGVVLTPNQKVTYHIDKQHFTTSVVDNPVILKSKKDKKTVPNFIYEETPIEVVVGELEQNYGIQIVVDNERFNNCPLTADLSEQTLFNKLEMICTPLNATFGVKGTTILIEGRGCN